MVGIKLEPDRVKMWKPKASDAEQFHQGHYARIVKDKGTPHPDLAEQLSEQAASAQQFHNNNGKTPAQRRKEHYASLSLLARFVWLCWMPVVWVTGHINIRAQWMVVNAQKVVEFVTAHASGPVSPWRMNARRSKCRPCENRRDKYCGAATCDCGDWKLTELKHLTRLSAVWCPKRKWGIGRVRQAYSWTRRLLAQRRKEF